MPAKPTRETAIRKNDNRRQEIADVAIPLFAVHGIEGVSLRDVAAVAGIKVGTLHYYFPEKQQLYQAVVDRALAVSSRTMRHHLEQCESPRDRLAGVIAAHFQLFVGGNPIGGIVEREMIRISTSDPSTLSAETVAEFRTSQAAMKAIIADIAGLPAASPRLDWLQQYAISSIYGVARMFDWYNQTKDAPIAIAQAQTELLDSLIAAFTGSSEA